VVYPIVEAVSAKRIAETADDIKCVLFRHTSIFSVGFFDITFTHFFMINGINLYEADYNSFP